jgi:hypothetical protein
MRSFGQIPDEQAPRADRDLVHDPVAEVLRENALEFLVADRGPIVAQHLVAALWRVGERSGLLDAAFGQMPKYLLGGGARAARLRRARIENFVAQRVAFTEVEDALLAVRRSCNDKTQRKKELQAAFWMAGLPKAASSCSRFFRAATTLFSLMCP